MISEALRQKWREERIQMWMCLGKTREEAIERVDRPLDTSNKDNSDIEIVDEPFDLKKFLKGSNIAYIDGYGSDFLMQRQELMKKGYTEKEATAILMKDITKERRK